MIPLANATDKTKMLELMRYAVRLGLCLLGLGAGGCALPASKSPPSALAPWRRLEVWQGSLTAEEWKAALNERFTPDGAGQNYLEITPGALIVATTSADSSQIFNLKTHAPDTPRPSPKRGARFWHTRDELGPATPARPLAGLRIALDPGHLGGPWGPLEARSFSFNGDPPVQEGDLALRVAQLLQPRLEALGAQVSFVRDRPGPVTGESFENFQPVPWSEMLPFLTHEIRGRAQRVNEVLKPDLVLCLHLDAVEWPDPQNIAAVNRPQHFHLIVNGSYLPAEVANDDQRLEMVERIASGADVEELAIAQAMAEGAVPVFGQPPSGYSLPTGVALGGNGYVWGRNLLADRLYRCPVVFMEPYIANSAEGYARIQAGEYEGEREFNGVLRKNVLVEYGDAVIAGLVNYYGKRPAASRK